MDLEIICALLTNQSCGRSSFLIIIIIIRWCGTGFWIWIATTVFSQGGHSRVGS